jgi:hypothetical protein
MSNPQEAWYARGALVELPYPTNDVRLMTKAAIAVVNRLLRRGFKYSKAKVLQIDLRQPGKFTDDLLAHSQPVVQVYACQRHPRLRITKPCCRGNDRRHRLAECATYVIIAKR